MKKLIALACAAGMLFSTSFAQTFSDLPETHWAQKVVEEMVEQKIISGYTDGTFRPTKNISKIESLILLARIAGINNYADAANTYLTKYESTLSKYTTQYKKDVAYLLGTNVLETSDLDNLLSADQVNAPITREEMAVLITKVMGKNEEVKKTSLIILPFADVSEITSSRKPYVHYVYSQKIMSGIDTEHFSPKTNVTRVQAACILQRIYKKVDIKPDTSTGSTNTTTGKISVLNGKITEINTSLKTVFIEDAKGNEEEYEYDSSTEFYVNTLKKTADEMKKGLTVTVTLKDDTYITLMKMTKNTTETITGTISNFDTSSETITVLKNAKTTKYEYSDSTKFYLDGKSSTASKALKKNYAITLTLVDEEVTKAEVKKSTQNVENTLLGKITKADVNEGFLVIQDENEKEYILMDDYIADYSENDEDYFFDDDSEFYYNDYSKDYKDVANNSYLYKKNYYVKITIENDGYLNKIEIGSAKSKLEEAENTITGKITLADDEDGYLIVKDAEGEEYILMDEYIGEYDENDEDYYFYNDAKFYYNGDSKEYDDIATIDYLYNKGYFVRFTFDADDILTKIEIASKESKLDPEEEKEEETTSTIVGKIIDAGKNDGYIIIEDSKGKEYILMDESLNEYKDQDEDYYFDRYTTFSYNSTSKTYNNASSTTYLYKLGLFMRITIDDNDYIEKLELSSQESTFNTASTSNTISKGYQLGTILNMYDDELIIEDKDGKEYTFEIGTDCVIIKKSSSDPERDLYYYSNDYTDVLYKNDSVMVFVYKTKSSKYYTSLIVLME